MAAEPEILDELRRLRTRVPSSPAHSPRAPTDSSWLTTHRTWNRRASPR